MFHNRNLQEYIDEIKIYFGANAKILYPDFAHCHIKIEFKFKSDEWASLFKLLFTESELLVLASY